MPDGLHVGLSRAFCNAVITPCTLRAVIDFCASCPALLVTGQQSVFNGTTRSLHQSILKTCGDKTKIEFIEVGGVANVLEEKVKLPLLTHAP